MRSIWIENNYLVEKKSFLLFLLYIILVCMKLKVMKSYLETLPHKKSSINARFILINII